MKIEEIVRKIKSIKSWNWYFEEHEFDDFYKEFVEKYPEVELDKKAIKRLGNSLVKGKDIPIDIKEEVQGNNVAFKCIYNDSGFNGRCSKELCEYNWKSGGVWCKESQNTCRNGDEFPCMESKIWKEFRFGSGIYQTGSKKGEPISLRNVRTGKIALLTTLEPPAPQEERYIFGIFKIIKVDDGRSGNEQIKEAFVYSDEENSIKINPEIKLNFWDFHVNENAVKEKDKKFWGSGLVRYLTDNEVFKVLTSLKEEYLKNNLGVNEINKIEMFIKTIKDN